MSESQGVKSARLNEADALLGSNCSHEIIVCIRAKATGGLVVNIDKQPYSDAQKASGLAVPFVGPENRDGTRDSSTPRNRRA